MDRSPTPERPKRAAPKRARPNGAAGGDEKNGKENKPPGSDGNDDVDVGVLLGTFIACPSLSTPANVLL